LTQRIQALKSDALKTLKSVVDVISKYSGGALPENARLLVRKHLVTLPARFRQASHSNATAQSNALQTGSGAQGDGAEVASSAQKVLVLAKEGLDMMEQVSGVLDGTIASAEEWCERLGRRKRGESEEGLIALNEKEPLPLDPPQQ
jgi:hypothetical protein